MSGYYEPKIESIIPDAGVENGKIQVISPGYEATMFADTALKFNGEPVRMSTVSNGLVTAFIPANTPPGDIVIEVEGVASNGVRLNIARLLATGLQPVCNPAVDSNGNIYVTLSGMRGQKVPVSIYKVTAQGSITPFASDILNPTGIVIDRHGEVYVSNRNDGTVHRVSAMGNHVTFADGLGVCTGLVFGEDENLFVGDREGTIYKLDPHGDKTVFAHLPSSVAAYHMAFSPDRHLYVTGPTISGYDHIYKIDQSGNVEIFFSEVGRPQGLVFDSEGNLHLVCFYKGRGGVIKITPEGKADYEVSGANLVGLAYNGQGDMIIVSSSSAYSLYVGDDGFNLQ